MRKMLWVILLVVALLVIVIMWPQRECLSVGIFPTQDIAEQKFKQYEGDFEENMTHYVQDMVNGGGPVQMWICK